MVASDTTMVPARTRRSLSPLAYRRVTFGALVLLATIIVTGAAVRLTGSGLGCPDWPNCTSTQFVSASTTHAAIEQTNRLFTGAVSVAVIAAVLGSFVRAPRRRDLTWWSLGLVAGVVGQIVLGGLVVIFDLSPWLVIGHFVLSMVLVWNAVVLHHRAGHDGRPQHPTVAPRVVAAGRALVVLATVVVATGTLVTGSGPHGGDERVERLPFLVHTVARIHGTTVMALVALVVATGFAMARSGVAARHRRDLLAVGAVLVAQATIGYVQYFTGVPVVLVGLHIAGATLLWVLVLRLHLGLFGGTPSLEAARP